MPPPPLERAALEDFVLGSLAVRADGSPSWRRRVSRSLGWYRRLVGHGAGALLFPLVHDLGYLMIHGEDFEFRALQDDTRDDPRPRALRLSYENALLNG